MSSTKNTGSGSAGPSKAGVKGKGKAADKPPKASNIEIKANVRDAIGGIEIETDGGWMPAVYLDEIRERVLQDTNAQGSYDHPPAKGNHALDVTAFHADHKSWGEARDQRPKILFEYKRIGREDPDYEVGIWMDNGRLVLGPDSLPIRDFRDIPKLCSSQMEGFRMEAISRLDSRIAISDFRARMMRDGLPGANAISMRKTRFRNRGRCLAWDRRAGSDFYEVQLRDEMTRDMINRNSTEELEDLSSAKTEKLQLDTAGKAPARSGKRALPDDVRALRFKTAREKNQKKLEAEAKLKQENTEQKSGSLESPSNTDNNVVSVTKRKRTTEDRLAESLQGYLDELLEEERPSKKRRNHESHSNSPEVLDAKKRKRTVGVETDSNDEEADEGRTFKRSRHYVLDLLPSTFSSEAPETSLPLPQGGSPAPNMGNTRRQIGNSRFEAVAPWELDEQPDWRGEDHLHESGQLEMGGANRVVDDRLMRPISALEQARVQNALSPTRRHYEFVTGLSPPETSPRENYLSQYGHLQHHFNQVWSESGIEDPAPALAGLDMWTPESLEWNQSTDLLLSIYGADGRRLFEELENELRDGLGDWFNQRAPRADMVQDWNNLGGVNAVNEAASEPLPGDEPMPAFNSTTAFEPFFESQPAAAFDPFAGINPSLITGSYQVDQPSSGFSTLTAFEPTATEEAQTSFRDALPDHAGRTTSAPAVSAPAVGDVTGSSSSPRYSGHLGPEEDFQSWLDSILEEPANAAPQLAVASTGVEQPHRPAFDDSFFDDAAAINNRRLDDLLFARAEEAQTVDPPLPPPQQTVRLDELNAPGLAEDFEMFSKGTDFWLS